MKHDHPTDSSFTLEQFEEWLKDQPEDRMFDYSSIFHCMIATFLIEYFEIKKASVGGYDYTLFVTPVISQEIPRKIFLALRGVRGADELLDSYPFTIGQFKQYYFV